MPLIEARQDGAIGTIALDRDKKRNALSNAGHRAFRKNRTPRFTGR
jgi:enoyl-CoA hydratase/carnithine racemase